jgi:hypothetical protein
VILPSTVTLQVVTPSVKKALRMSCAITSGPPARRSRS